MIVPQVAWGGVLLTEPEVTCVFHDVLLVVGGDVKLGPFGEPILHLNSGGFGLAVLVQFADNPHGGTC